ncbi:hypothetical protein ACEQ8H_005984 [Pleosporales sp. CAS-2024a]
MYRFFRFRRPTAPTIIVNPPTPPDPESSAIPLQEQHSPSTATVNRPRPTPTFATIVHDFNVDTKRIAYITAAIVFLSFSVCVTIITHNLAGNSRDIGCAGGVGLPFTLTLYITSAAHLTEHFSMEMPDTSVSNIYLPLLVLFSSVATGIIDFLLFLVLFTATFFTPLSASSELRRRRRVTRWTLLGA